MRKRLLLVVACGAALLLAGYFLILSLGASGDAISRETYGKIRRGMTEQEVRQVVGIPPGRYGSGPILETDIDECILAPGVQCLTWYGQETAIFVDLDEAGRVCGKQFRLVARGEPSFFALLRYWLGW